MESWVHALFQDDDMTLMGHGQSKHDANLGLGWLYYGLARIAHPRVAVVIGSWRGFVPIVIAKALADNGQGGEVVFIDPSLVDDFWRNPHAVTRHFHEHGAHNIRHYLMTTEAFTESETYRQLDEIGLVFIDGNHSYNCVRYDFEAFEGKLARDGFILLHDSLSFDIAMLYGDAKAYVHQVTVFVDELRADPRFETLDIACGAGVTVVTPSRRPDRAPHAADDTSALNSWLRIGAELFNSGRPREAAACFDAAEKLAPEDSPILMLKGAALARAGAHRDATRCFEQAERLADPYTARRLRLCKRVFAAAATTGGDE